MTVQNAMEDAARAEREAAEAEAAAATAVAAQAGTGAAAAGVAAAQAGAELARAEAARTITENQEEMTWLRQHAAQVDDSLKSLKEGQSQIQGQVSSQLQSFKAEIISGVREVLTPPAPTQVPTPSAKPENAGDPPEAKTEKKKRRFL